MKTKTQYVAILITVLLSACSEENWNDCQCELNGQWSYYEYHDWFDGYSGSITTNLDIEDGVGSYHRVIDIVDSTYLDGEEVFTIEFLSCDSAIKTGYVVRILEQQIDTVAVFDNIPLPVQWSFYDGCDALVMPYGQADLYYMPDDTLWRQ